MSNRVILLGNDAKLRYFSFMRKILSGLLAITFLHVSALSFSFAADNETPVPEKSPKKQDEVINTIKPSNEEKSFIDTGKSLDELFAKLKKDAKPKSAKTTAGMIWREWSLSGSDSIDLLMSWAGTAMNKQQYSTAEDLLDQVVILAPDYAEGWNRRATLYFLQTNFSQSISDIEKTLALEPRHFGALAGLAGMLQQIEKHEEALEAWYQVLEIYPANKQAQSAVIFLEDKLAGKGI